MKVLKNAKQKNVILDKDYYTTKQIADMLLAKEIFFIDEDYNCSYDYKRATEDTECFRVKTMKNAPIPPLEMMFHYADLLREIPNAKEQNINEFWANFVLILEIKNK